MMTEQAMVEQPPQVDIAEMQFAARFSRERPGEPLRGTDAWDLLKEGVKYVPADVTEARKNGKEVFLLIDPLTGEKYWLFLVAGRRIVYSEPVS